MIAPFRTALLLCLLALVGVGHAATYYVRQHGSDVASGASPATAFRTVTRAAQACNNGDSIVIGPGVYVCSVVIADRFTRDDARMRITGDERGTLTGDPAGPVVLQPATPAEPALLLHRLNRLTLSGLTFRGDGAGLRIDRCHDVSVERCTFRNLAKGVSADTLVNFSIESSVFANCIIGLGVQSCATARLAHLSFAGNRTAALMVLGSANGTIRNCLFAANGTAMSVDQMSTATWSSDYNVITGPLGPWGDGSIVSKAYEWFPATGQERHSLYVEPAFVDPERYDLHIAPAVTWPGGLPGMTVGTATFAAKADRDGLPFRVRNKTQVSAGAYAYPDPVLGGGWRKLIVKWPSSGPRQSAGIYREDGTLVRMLVSDVTGLTDLYWDGLDDLGHPAAAGAYQVRAIAHDVRLLDDGAIGDNGALLGKYNCDNADRVAAFSDGTFTITTEYDEAGYPLRRYNASGACTFASPMDIGNFWEICAYHGGPDLIAGLGKGTEARLVRLEYPGEQAPLPHGETTYAISPQEPTAVPLGMAVVDDLAYIALGGVNVVRVIDLHTGERRADLPMADLRDIAADGDAVWVLAGTDIVQLRPDGTLGARYATKLATPAYLAASANRLAVADRKANTLLVLEAATGREIARLGRARTQHWMPVRPDTYRDLRQPAILPDGRVITTESGRVRIFAPEHPAESVDINSIFMETAVVHPTNPAYVYCSTGVFQVDPTSGAWRWVLESPPLPFVQTKEEDVWAGKRLGSPSHAVVLDGRPYLNYNGIFVDVSDPLQPRQCPAPAKGKPNIPYLGLAYTTFTFTRGNAIVTGMWEKLSFKQVKYLGLDAEKNPVYDFANPITLGPVADPLPGRQITNKGGMSCDTQSGDLYFLAVTPQYNQMVPMWGADGTGIGKCAADGTPRWFVLSSGNNYMSVSTVNDGKTAWTLAAKSFGGQTDLFDADGLRVTTGNWGRLTGYAIGFVDLRYGIHAYMRPDGKVGAYVEDDAIGRFARYRLDGGETYQRSVTPITWGGAGVEGGLPPLVDRLRSTTIPRRLPLKRVAALPVDGDWTAWERQGVVPQIVAMPCNASYKRVMAEDLMRTFREGTVIGAVAHDGKSIYTYFVVADNTPFFLAKDPSHIWMYDGIELWLEEEQVGIGLLADGTAGLFKWKQHNREGKQYAANYVLPRENVWGARVADLAAHPLGRQLAAVTGVSMAGKSGYALMARVPMEEVKLVGGIEGRQDGAILPMTGQAGEIIRLGVSLDNISHFGRRQEYMVDWPLAKMYADPTTFVPFVLE